MVRVGVVLIALMIANFTVQGAKDDSLTAVSIRQGMILSGMGAPHRQFFMLKYEYLFDQVGIQISFTSDVNNRPGVSDKTVDRRRQFGCGLTFRYYSPKPLKGVYGAVALSSANAFLNTFNDDLLDEKDSDFLNLGGAEIGYRWVTRNDKLLTEVGFRRMYSFNNLVLSNRNYSIPFKPDDSTDDGKWTIESGKAIDHIYLSLGYLF